MKPSAVLVPVLVPIALSLVAGCASSAGRSDVSAVAPSDRPVLGKLQMRDRDVTLLASPGGLRVTIEDARGAVLARDVGVAELQSIDPLVYEMFRQSVASNRPYLDARLDEAPAAPEPR
jgi:hypothetical protein